MEDHGIFQNDKLMLICGSKEKAEEMKDNYSGGEVWPVEHVKGKWIRKH